MSDRSKRRIAIIGSGISGLGAAYALRHEADLTIYEKRGRPGGHANTVTIDHGGMPVTVDTGFIVFNTLTYPNFCPLLDELGISSHESDMSFSFSVQGGLEWSSNPQGLFAQKRNLFSPAHWKLLGDILRFNKTAQLDLVADRIGDLSLGEWLDRHRFDHRFRHRYILPMGAAIWSSDDAKMAQVSANSFLRFFRNHRLLNANRPKWRTVTGGSHAYVQAMVNAIGEERFCFHADIAAVEQGRDQAKLIFADGLSEHFDEVVLCVHSDTARKLVRNANQHTADLLRAIPYSRNRVWLHRDARLMPTRRAAWAAWNALTHTEGAPAEVTYWMNPLQGIQSARPLFVTLNAQRQPDPGLTYGEYAYNHPQFSPASDAAQGQFAAVQGQGHVWYAGAWLGYGFHEDGLRTGLQVARALGGKVGFGIDDGDTPYRLTRLGQEHRSSDSEACSA
jgi:uncharacterized protein